MASLVAPRQVPEKLRALAERMDDAIARRLDPAIGRQNVTARRARIADGMQRDAEGLRRVQAALRSLADLRDLDALPPLLTRVVTRAQVTSILTQHFPRPIVNSIWLPMLRQAALRSSDPVVNSCYLASGEPVWDWGDLYWDPTQVDAIIQLFNQRSDMRPQEREWATHGLRAYRRALHAGLGTQSAWEEAKRLLRSLGHTTPTPAEQRIRGLERDLIGCKIPGYFPTPPQIVQRMLDEADIQPGHRVLEPSAGKGNIADAIRSQHPHAHLTVIEPWGRLREVLSLKQHVLHEDDDFLTHATTYDRIVMNPPFEKGQDVDHVRHAYELLRPGGRLVAIMSEGPFFRADRKSAAFRTWLQEHEGEAEQLPPGSFLSSENSTGVSTRIVTVSKRS